MLKIQNLHAAIAGEQAILHGVNLEVPEGEIHVIMGQNGSGKSTLAKTIAGHPGYEIISGNIQLHDQDVNDLEPDERSKAGIFLAFQYPVEIPGVNFSNFLRLAYNARLEDKEKVPPFAFRKLLKDKAKLLGINLELLERNLNEGLSGGEKKKTEILQLAMLEPKIAILDETDSGLDLDALREVFQGLQTLKEKNSELSILIITHYQRIFDYIKPDKIHVMNKGQIVKSGGMEIVEQIVANGYSAFK